MFGRITDRMIVMSRYADNAVSYAPFYIHSFRLIAAHKLVEAEKFNIRYTSPAQIDNTPDRLRWYRYHWNIQFKFKTLGKRRGAYHKKVLGEAVRYRLTK